MGDRLGLLVVDVQNAMFEADEPMYQGREVTQRIAGLLEQARAAEVPVIFIRHTEAEGPFVEGSPSWQIHDTVAPQPGESIFQKETPDSFEKTPLNQHLQEIGVDRLVIVGMQTDYCINATSRRAAELGYRPILASDAHTTFDEGGETAEEIIARYNQELAEHSVELKPAAQISFV